MKHASPQPIMGPTDLFFSTTDPRGVIRQGNSVFARVSGFPLESLLDAPHNIVRHPQMPAGAFRIMWEFLQAGRTVATYVCNRTANGGEYWVCAIVSPIDDGYLSVRFAPLTTGLTLVREVYAVALAAEAEAAATGAPRREVAEVGAAALLAELGRRGFTSYEAFMQAATVGERAARRSLTLTLHQRPAATGEVARILDGTRAVAERLESLVGSLATYQQLSDELARATSGVLGVTAQLQRSVQAAQVASASVADQAPVLANVADVMAAPMNAAVAALNHLPDTFRHLNDVLAGLRFQIALAATYVDMASGFAAEAWDGDAPEGSLSAVPLLVATADVCVSEMADEVEQVNADLRALGTQVAAANEQLAEFRRMIGRWRQLTLRHASAALADRVGPVDEAVAATWASAEELVNLGEKAAQAILPFDAARMHQDLEGMRVTSRA